MRHEPLRWSLLVFSIGTGCVGVIGEPSDDVGQGPSAPGSRAGSPPGSGGSGIGSDPGPGQPPGQVSGALGRTAFGPGRTRRLSKREYVDTVKALTGVDVPAADLLVLPGDSRSPFDNDADEQLASQALVDALMLIAEQVATLALADPANRARLVPCTPQGVDDTACLRRFIESFGRRVLRRPLRKEEVDDFATVQAVATKARDFYAGINVAMQAFLQDTEFLHRVEIGTPVAGQAGLVQLGDLEVASRLSFLLWGTGPTDAVLDDAAAGKLAPGAPIRAVASQMLKDPRARARLDRMFAMWLGYEFLPYDANLAASMRRETDALVERIIFDRRSSWWNLFTANDTFLDDPLAKHYRLTKPTGAPAWVDYGHGPSGRKGLLSHGSLLALGAKGNDTSPVRRGLAIRKRFMCEEIPLPPAELMVDIDEAPSDPTGTLCKRERYAKYTKTTACSSCHNHMDPIGFGLENYNHLGQYRTHDDGRPACVISGEGNLAGAGSFKGPAELGQLLINTEALDACFVTHLYSFALGRKEQHADEATLRNLVARFRGTDRRIDDLLLSFVSEAAFRHRQIE